MNTLRIMALLALAIPACDRKKPSEATSTVETASVASARSDEDMLRAEISRGLEEHFNVFNIPVGDVEIMSGLSSQMERNDFKKKRFKDEFFKFLKDMEAKGLITLAELRQSELDAIGRMGARTVTVTPTDKAKQQRDEKLSSTDYLAFRMASCDVRQIVRSSPYQSPRLSQSEEYRLVLGTYHTKALPWFRALEPKSEDKEYKFRAVLQLNPFTKRYAFQFADYGDPQKDDWATNNVQ